MVKILIVLLLLVAVGVIVITVLAAFSPKRLTDDKGQFRYDVATILIFFWWLSIVWLVVWCFSWPARKLVSKRITPDK